MPRSLSASGGRLGRGILQDAPRSWAWLRLGKSSLRLIPGRASLALFRRRSARCSSTLSTLAAATPLYGGVDIASVLVRGSRAVG